MLHGKKIALGVTGSIAAYKAVEIVRRLKELGASVRVVMTTHATRFVSPLTFAVLSEQPVLSDEFQDGSSDTIGHIAITDSLDLALVAPATANLIGKVAAGIADDALTSALMALDCPLVMAPAMNDRMYRNPALQSNISLLKQRGVRFIEPEAGPLACGVSGHGRLADTEAIINGVVSVCGNQVLSGKTILVTAGPTRERIDAVRFISNPSTGKMGYAVAVAARDRGAQVILVSGPTQLEPPDAVECIHVGSAAEMQRAVRDRVKEAHGVIMTAAVSDFRPATASNRKMKKDTVPDMLVLERTEDILRETGTIPGDRVLVGFAAETDSIVQNATEKLQQKNLDMIVANDLLQEGAGFASDTNSVIIIHRSGAVSELPVLPKAEIASRILDNVVELMVKRGILP